MSQSEIVVEASQKFIVVGQIGAPYGVNGWHHIRSFTQPKENILVYSHWYIKKKAQWIHYELVSGRLHRQALVAKLKGITDRETAAQLTLSEVAVLRDALAPIPPDQFYWVDLEGLLVQTVSGEEMGQVAYLYTNGGTDILVVSKEAQEQHLPFIMHDTIVEVDLAGRRIIVNWDIANCQHLSSDAMQ